MMRVAQGFLFAALLVGAWWVGARSAQAQMVVLGLSAVALLAAAIASTDSAPGSRRLSRNAIIVVVILLVFLGLQVVRLANPSFILQKDGLYWRLIPLPHLSLLPSGFEGPFDGLSQGDLSFTNPLRHLIVFGAAFCATVAAFIVGRNADLRWTLLWALVVHAAVVSIVSIIHRLSGSAQTLWFHEETEFWTGSPLFPYRNAGAAYQVLLIGVCLAMFRSVRERANGERRLLWTLGILSGLALIALFFLTSRAGVLMGVALTLLFLFLEVISARRQRSTGGGHWLRAVLIAAMVSAGCWLLFRGGFATTLGRFGSEFTRPMIVLRGGEPRIQKQRIAVLMARDRLWFGWGGGAYLCLFPTYHPLNPGYLHDLLQVQPDRNRIYEVSADGDWWEFPVEYGLVGVALLVASIGLGIRMWFQAGGPQCVSSIYLMAAGGLVVLHGIIDRILRDVVVLSMMGVVMALAIRMAQAQKEAANRASKRRTRRTAA